MLDSTGHLEWPAQLQCLFRPVGSSVVATRSEMNEGPDAHMIRHVDRHCSGRAPPASLRFVDQLDAPVLRAGRGRGVRGEGLRIAEAYGA